LRLRAYSLYGTFDGFGLEEFEHARMVAIGCHKCLWDEDAELPLKTTAAITLSALALKSSHINRLLIPSRVNFADRILDLMQSIDCEELVCALEAVAKTFSKNPPKNVENVMIRLTNSYQGLKNSEGDQRKKLSLLNTIRRMLEACKDSQIILRSLAQEGMFIMSQTLKENNTDHINAILRVFLAISHSHDPEGNELDEKTIREAR
jgi:hypothetical protein